MKDIIELLRGPLGPLMMGSAKAADELGRIDQSIDAVLELAESGRIGDAVELLRGLRT